MYLFTQPLEWSPRFKAWFWKTLYQYLAGFKVPEWKFMNYGYAYDDDIYVVDLAKEDEPDRYSIQLYERVISNISLKNKVILEIGCGRGGGLSYIQRYHNPNVSFGIDLSEKAIEFCKENHKIPGLVFEVGDAIEISLPSESVDAVINVESSHCYPSLPLFFNEVHRVLKPDGHFLYADLCKTTDKPVIEAQLYDAGFQLVKQENIVDGILDALTLDNSRKEAMIREKVPFYIRWFFNQFAGMLGSRTYKSFLYGVRSYNRYILKKSV